MKILFFIIFIFLSIATFGQNISDAILKAQKKALKLSPYKDAKWFSVPKAQIQYRQTKFPKLISDIISNKTKLSDTLWIVETFDELCLNCISYSCDILYGDSLYTIDKQITDPINRIYFKVISFSKELNSSHYIISEVVDSVTKKKNWRLNPLTYGENFCADGDHTLVTIVYPDLHIESMYVRCWSEPTNRIKK